MRSIAWSGLISIIAFLMASRGDAGTWTLLDAPGESFTYFYGVDGGKIVGRCSSYAFIYDGTNWTKLSKPGATSIDPIGISGNNIVGRYFTPSGEGFFFDGTTWTTLTAPGSVAGHTLPSDVDGSNTVGYYFDGTRYHGFLYDGMNWTTLDASSIPTSSTVAEGISGNKIVGYSDGHGFVYDGVSWKNLVAPSALNTYARGIDGDNIVGNYHDRVNGPSRGFLYDGIHWTPLDVPGARMTLPWDIDGDTIVGYYEDSAGCTHGFIYTIPEPATLMLFSLGGVWLRRKRFIKNM